MSYQLLYESLFPSFFQNGGSEPLEAPNSPFSTMNMLPPTPTVVVQNCNPRIWELETSVKCQPGLQNKQAYICVKLQVQSKQLYKD